MSESTFTPFPDQIAYLAAIREAWLTFLRILVVSPTGSGKTVMFSWVVKEFLDLEFASRALILVDQDELVWQTIRKLREVAGIHGEAEKAEWRASNEAIVVVATVQSLARRLDKYPADAFGLVVADEADKSITPQWQSVLNHFPKAKVCGFTATPHRTDQINLGVYYQKIIELENLWSLIAKGRLCPLTIQTMPIRIDMSAFKTRGADFSNEEADEIITPHLEAICKCITRICEFRRTLVFLPLIKTCQKFNDIARSMGLNSDYVYGQDPERESKIQRFKDWDFDVLANSMLLTRGVDIPETDCVIPCRPTKSVTLYFQMVGRGTRVAKNKKDLLLLDFLYQSASKLKCRPAFLIAKTDEEAESITKFQEDKFNGMPTDIASTMDLIQLAGDATAQREAALKKKLEEQRNKQAQTISAAEFARKYNDTEAAEYRSELPLERQQLSPQAKKHLERANIDISTVQGMEHAQKLLGIYYANKPLQLASHSQRDLMKRMHYPNWANATEGEAKQFFAKLNQRKKAA